jgi:Uma2 family endonuclease
VETIVAIDEHDLYPFHEEDHVTQGDPHYWQIHYLGGSLTVERPDLRITCDLCHYWEPGNTDRYVAPDVSVIAAPPPSRRRGVYLAWVDPPLLFVAEIASPSKTASDVAHKNAIYELVLQVPEYLEADAERRELHLWQLVDDVYRDVAPDANGRVRSVQLDLWFGYDQEDFLRIYTPEGVMLPTHEEQAQQVAAEALRREQAERQAAAEARRREQAERRAAAATQQAEAEAQRSAEVERQLAELAAEVERLRQRGPNSV